MNEIFGNTLEDGKLINFNNASDESKKQIGKKIKERIDKYINNSDESSKIVEENAKDVVETEAAKEMSREAVNQSDNQQPITNNETQVDPELNLLKRAWKAIKNFISKWVWRTDTSIDNIFNRIASGYYNRSKQNSAAVNEFLAAYKGAGAPFKVRGHKFKNINNTQFKETVHIHL